MATGTALSRATGLLRTVALAAALGVSALGDAYNNANTIPNMVFTLVAGGVLSSAVVPLLVGEDDERKRKEIASVLFGLIVVIGVIASVLLALAAPLIMRGLTLAARDRAGYDSFLSVGTMWLYMFAAQVLFYTVSVFTSGVLQSRGRLALVGAAPIATNLITIAAAIGFLVASGGRPASPDEMTTGPMVILGMGTTAGVLAMALLQLIGARRAEPGLRVALRLGHPVVGELRRLGSWVLLYVVVNQLGYVGVVTLANSVEGGVSAYQWAFAVMQLPYAVMAVSVLSAAFPRIARAAKDRVSVTQEIERPARLFRILLVPAAVGLALLAPQLATAVVGEDGAPLVAAALGGFAVSLVPFSMFQLLTRTSYAARDGRTPALVNITVNAVNLMVDMVIVFSVNSPRSLVAGLALGHAASYAVGCVVLARALATQGRLQVSVLLRGISRVAVATLVMTAVVATGKWLLPPMASRAGSITLAGVLATIGVTVYLAAAKTLGALRAP